MIKYGFLIPRAPELAEKLPLLSIDVPPIKPPATPPATAPIKPPAVIPATAPVIAPLNNLVLSEPVNGICTEAFPLKVYNCCLAPFFVTNI